jgi:two-component system sensor kinase FixL
VAVLAGALLAMHVTLIRATRRRHVRQQQHRDELAFLARRASMGELTAALAHELNQPLGAIRANAEAAGRFLASESPDLDELREILDDIIQDDQRATEVIERIRGSLVGRPFEPEPLDIRATIDSVLGLVRVDAARRGAHIEVDAGGGLPRVLGDPIQLEQVLLNLVLNGFDATQGVPAARLEIRAESDVDGRVEVSVRDNGEGTGGRDPESLFESFFTTKPDGMGMGLAISRSIVQAHGGRIWATENPDRGLAFHFTVPVAP